MVQVVNAAVSDTPAIQALLRETWNDTYGDHLSPETLAEVYRSWQSIEVLTKQIENPTLYFPLAKNGDQLVGLSTAQMSDETIVMFRLYVSPSHQRKGIGERLLRDVIEHFRGAKRIQLAVELVNTKGRSFYTKHGFRDLQRGEEKIGSEVIQVMMMERPI